MHAFCFRTPDDPLLFSGGRPLFSFLFVRFLTASAEACAVSGFVRRVRLLVLNTDHY